MSQLKIYSNDFSTQLEMETRLPLEIAELLDDAGIVYEHMDIPQSAGKTELADDVLEELKQRFLQGDRSNGFQYCSVASVGENFPNYDRLRLRYLSEYYVEEDEGYLVMEGKCLFGFHYSHKVMLLWCEKGDYVKVPANILRWMDMGIRANFSVLKCSEHEEAPVIFYTGSNISDIFPRLVF